MHNNILNGIEEVNRFVSIYIQVDYMSMKKPSIHNHKMIHTYNNPLTFLSPKAQPLGIQDNGLTDFTANWDISSQTLKNSNVT